MHVHGGAVSSRERRGRLALGCGRVKTGQGVRGRETGDE
jgi:hypothetical protein